MSAFGQGSLNTRRTLSVGDREYDYYSLEAAQSAIGDISRLPFSLKVLLENLLRFEDGRTVSTDDIRAVADWLRAQPTVAAVSYPGLDGHPGTSPGASLLPDGAGALLAFRLAGGPAPPAPSPPRSVLQSHPNSRWWPREYR